MCIATHQFPLKWLGGNGTVKKMKALCEEKGFDVIGTVVIDWSPEYKRVLKIENVVDYLAGLVG